VYDDCELDDQYSTIILTTVASHVHFGRDFLFVLCASSIS
jgi:hypothetical protein